MPKAGSNQMLLHGVRLPFCCVSGWGSISTVLAAQPTHHHCQPQLSRTAGGTWIM